MNGFSGAGFRPSGKPSRLDRYPKGTMGLPEGLHFLDKNGYLYRETGEKKINDNALVALALLVAVSDPKDKDTMIKIISNLLK